MLLQSTKPGTVNTQSMKAAFGRQALVPVRLCVHEHGPPVFMNTTAQRCVHEQGSLTRATPNLVFMYKTHKEHKRRPFMNKTQILLFALGGGCTHGARTTRKFWSDMGVSSLVIFMLRWGSGGAPVGGGHRTDIERT